MYRQRTRNVASSKHRINPLRLPLLSSLFPCRPARRAALGLLAAGLPLAGCSNAPAAFGRTRAEAAANASDFFAAAAYRFTNVQRDPKFAAARPKLGRHALTPSKIFGDSAVWSVRGASDRTLLLSAGYANGRYGMAATGALPALARPGDARHVIRLQRLAGDDVFLWTTTVDFAVGRMRAADAESVVESLLSAAEGRTGAALRADYRGAFPRTAAAMGRLFTIDTVRTTLDAAGATMVDLSISLHTKRLRAASFGAFADYVDKYVAPARYRLTVTDRAGVPYFTTAAARNRLSLRVRVKDGRLVAFTGPPRRMPAGLLLRSEAFAKFGIFTVGASDLVSEFTIVRSPSERGWFLRFNREPRWHLPLAAATLLKSPLRRPFAGGGTTLGLTVRDAPGAPTVIARHTQSAVQESAVLRFLGSLGSAALDDFAGKSEEEENRFWAEAFQAMRADAAALTGPVPGE